MHHMPTILPVGTQIVSHVPVRNPTGDVLFAAGAVGVIVKAPQDASHSYRVQFMDGSEHVLKPDQLAVRSHYQNPTAANTPVTSTKSDSVN